MFFFFKAVTVFAYKKYVTAYRILYFVYCVFIVYNRRGWGGWGYVLKLFIFISVHFLFMSMCKNYYS